MVSYRASNVQGYPQFFFSKLADIWLKDEKIKNKKLWAEQKEKLLEAGCT